MKDVRQPVRDVITTAARGAGFFVQELLTNLGDDVLSCENVGAVLSAFKSPVCYSTVGPLAWFVGMLYLAGFAMCCVGLPAACSMQRHYRLLGMENRVSVYDDEGGDEGMGEGGQGGGEGGTGGRDMLDEVAVLAALQKEIYGMSLQPASA
ncbi:hypothetical protein B484DRAFT_415722 [Ochromonadaceae sp. CCMP2298]|nr:hypothetical protein B484DRAFT_415722 [Ochromonadaceae sp. CCMP2298]